MLCLLMNLVLLGLAAYLAVRLHQSELIIIDLIRRKQ
jgi:hypothetical protein